MSIICHFWHGSVIGENHLRQGIPNQDYCMGFHFPWGELVVVADGVGSCPKSDIGSRAACRAAATGVNFCVRKGVTDFERIQLLVYSLWLSELGAIPPEDACSTCRMAFTLKDNLYLLSIGDGMTALCSDSPENTIVLEEDKENQFVNETYALSPEPSFSEWRGDIYPMKSFKGVLLSTDGVSENYQRKTRPIFACSVLNSFVSMKSWHRRREMAKTLSRHAPGNMDDRTMICLYWEKKQ